MTASFMELGSSNTSRAVTVNTQEEEEAYHYHIIRVADTDNSPSPPITMIRIQNSPVFPSNPIKRQLWIKALQRKDWEPNLTTCLCSAHFKEEEIDRTANLVRIRDGAVPSIFQTTLNDKASRNPRKRRSSDSDSPPARTACVETIENPSNRNLQKGASKINLTLNFKRKNCKRKCDSRFSNVFTCNTGICESTVVSDNHITSSGRTTFNPEVKVTSHVSVVESPNIDACLSTIALEKSPCENLKNNIKTSQPRKKHSNSALKVKPQGKSSSIKEMTGLDRRGSEKKYTTDHVCSVPSTSKTEMHGLSKVGDEHEESQVEKTLKTQLQRKEERIKSLKKKIRLLQQTTRRMTRRVKTLKEVVNGMKTKFRLQQESNSSLDEFSGPSLFLVKRQLIKMEGGKLQRIYNEKLKDFAITLNFISSPAYDYVRRVFGDCLPHKKTISKWILSNKKQLTKDCSALEVHDVSQATGTLAEQCVIGDVGLVGAPGYVEVPREDPEISAAVLGIQLGEEEDRETKTLISL